VFSERFEENIRSRVCQVSVKSVGSVASHEEWLKELVGSRIIPNPCIMSCTRPGTVSMKEESIREVDSLVVEFVCSIVTVVDLFLLFVSTRSTCGDECPIDESNNVFVCDESTF